jgi:hypothetical protein
VKEVAALTVEERRRVTRRKMGRNFWRGLICREFNTRERELFQRSAQIEKRRLTASFYKRCSLKVITPS